MVLERYRYMCTSMCNVDECMAYICRSIYQIPEISIGLPLVLSCLVSKTHLKHLL